MHIYHRKFGKTIEVWLKTVDAILPDRYTTPTLYSFVYFSVLGITPRALYRQRQVLQP